MSVAYLGSYCRHANAGGLLPDTARERGVLLGLFMLERAVKELRHELLSRPQLVAIPLDGIETASRLL